MKTIRWIASAAALAALGGCVVVSSEKRETKTYEFSGFDSVTATSGVNVVLKQGPFSVSAEGPKNRLDLLDIGKSGSTLKVANKPHMDWGFVWTGPTIVTVVAPDYQSIDASGGADVDIESLKLDGLDLNAHGGADVNLDGLSLGRLGITASGGADINLKGGTLDQVKVEASGGADVQLVGACKALEAEISSGADLSARDLRCETASVDASGGADAGVYATASARGRARGGSDINVHGNPGNVDSDESGGGDVNVASN